MRVLIADDETELLNALRAIFENEHYTVDTAENGQDALTLLEDNRYDAAVLDVMMPQMSGIEVLRAIRAEKNATPVLLLTALSAVDDRVTGLDTGADDYLVKPFATRELLARVRALLRRPETCLENELRFLDIRLDGGSGQLCRGNIGIRLNNKEYQVMELLMRTPRRLISAERFISQIWNDDAEQSLVWVNIASLRKKLAQLDSEAAIHSRRGVGYLLEERKSC